MSKYLDKIGLEHFLKKIKEYISNNYFSKKQTSQSQVVSQTDEININ